MKIAYFLCANSFLFSPVFLSFMMPSTAVLFAVVFSFSATLTTIAQERYNASRGLDPTKAITQYIHESWNTSNGLPQNNGHALCQTRDGYIWIGTQEGLVRFDGMRFTVFNNKNSILPDNWINALAEDRTGRLWIGSARGDLLSLRGGQFTLYGKEQGYTGSSSVNGILEDRTGRVWIATNDGLFCVENAAFSPLTTTTGLLSNNVRALCEDASGTLWIGTEKGVQIRTGTPQQGTWTAAYTIAQGLCDNNIYALSRDSSGAVWIGAKNGLSRFLAGTFTNFTTAQGLSNKFIRALLCDGQGTVWIATTGGGVCRYTQGRFSAFKRADGLDADETFSLLADKEGELWVGSRGGGIHRFREGSFTAITTANGLAGNNVRAVREDVQGRIWIGCAGGLSRIDKGLQGDTVALTFRDDSLAGVNLGSLFIDAQDRIWSGTNSKGLLRFVPKGLSLQMSAFQDTLLSGTLQGIAAEQNGQMWVSTGKGVTLVSAKGKPIRRYGKQDGITDKGIINIFRSRTGTFWFGSNAKAEGLFTLQNGAFAAFQGNVSGGKSALPIRVLTLCEDADTVLWVGTYQGLFRVLPNGSIHMFTIKDGLFENYAFAIVEDDYGYLWISCNTGIYRVKKADLNAYVDAPPEKRQRLSCTVYGTADGMKSSECNSGQPSGYKSADGRLWFATIRGVVVVDPKRMVYNPVSPNVIVEEMRVDGAVSTTATLPSTTEKLEFQYTATCLTAAERVKFKYILEGYDKDWVEAGNRRTAYYNNLPRGRTYRFRVIACNNDGVWNETGAWAEFRITPFWWETWWFYGLCALFVGSASYQGFRWRTSRLRAKAEELERLVDVRTREVQEQAKEIQLANTQLSEKNVEITASRERLEVMSEVGRSLTASLAVETIITNLYQRVAEVMDATVFGIGIVREAKGVIEYKLAMDKGERFPPYERDLHDTNQFPVWSITQQKSVFINDVDLEGAKYIPSFIETINAHDETVEDYPKSLLYVPLLLEGSPIGVLSVQSYNRNAYSETDLDTLQTLANYAAIAIANAESTEEIIRQKAIVEEFNRNIQDSIRYAKRIQDAMLPSTETLNRLLPEHFIFFRPKDVVSGDFYWCKQVRGLVFVAAVDCTGHGVPGAFMSLIGNSLLNDITQRLLDPHPDLVLNELHRELQTVLRQKETNNDDGMDICLCMIDLDTRIVEFAGAMNPLYAVVEGELKEFKGTPEELGGREERSPVYERHTLDLSDVPEGASMLYLTTDGYKDQYNDTRQRFMPKRLRPLLTEIAGKPLEEQPTLLGEAIDAHRGEVMQVDDMLVLGVRL